MKSNFRAANDRWLNVKASFVAILVIVAVVTLVLLIATAMGV